MRTHTALIALSIGLMGSMDAVATTPVESFEDMAVAAGGTGTTPAPDSRLAGALRDEGCKVLSSFALGPGIMKKSSSLDPALANGATGTLETVMTVSSMGLTAYATCAGHNVSLVQHVRVTTPEGGTMSNEVRLQATAEEDGIQWGTVRSIRSTRMPYLVVWRDAGGVQHSMTYFGQVDEATARAYLMPMAKRISQQLR